MTTHDDGPDGSAARLVGAADMLDSIAGVGALALGLTGLAVAALLGERSLVVLLVVAVLGGVHAWFAYAAAGALSSIARALASDPRTAPTGAAERSDGDGNP